MGRRRGDNMHKVIFGLALAAGGPGLALADAREDVIAGSPAAPRWLTTGNGWIAITAPPSRCGPSWA